jgi:hypothetical protein
VKDNLAAYFLDIVRSEAFMKWECHHRKLGKSKSFDMIILLRPMELMREILPQLKSLCEAIYAESILKHIIDRNCQGMAHPQAC